MPFKLVWRSPATEQYLALREQAVQSKTNRERRGKSKSSRQEGLFNQLVKALRLLESDPRHPGLQTHAFQSLEHPYRPGEKVWEAYVQNRTPGAYRIFWCYGPGHGEITILAITPHP